MDERWLMYFILFYLKLDFEDILGYPNKCCPHLYKNLPTFDGVPLVIVPYILVFMRHVSKFEEKCEDVMIRLFIYSLGNECNGQLNYSCSPKEIPSLKALIENFIKHYGITLQRVESTYQHLFTILQQECLVSLLEGDEDIYENDNESPMEEQYPSMELNEYLDEE